VRVGGSGEGCGDRFLRARTANGRPHPLPSAAARTRLRKHLADATAKAAALIASGAGSGSPHAKAAYDAAEFGALAAKFEALAWRAVSKPGGATVKPDEYYELAALAAQATAGDATGERPMWAERGGLDFDGRARWDARAAVKGVSPGAAKARFVQAYYEFSARALYSDGR
jgi:acyl-CoA-binding protein